MQWLILFVLLVVAGGIIWRLITKAKQRQQLAFLEHCPLPSMIGHRWQQKHPHLDAPQIELVYRALRDYFHICNRAGRRMVSMPSQVVDDAWHEFILSTRAYHSFCNEAFGRFLHHTPAEAMASPTSAQEGIKQAWRLACEREGIDPHNPARLPLLFAIDGQLKIANGFTYTLNCRDAQSQANGNNPYCGSHIGCGGGCAGDSGCGDTGGDSGCGGGCGGD